MERKFYSENFEKFLKGHADQFKMTPSKKVWHGIYNDLHPGRRWPSVAMSMVFIFTLVIIGHLNTNNGHIPPLYSLASLQGSISKPVTTSEAVKQAGQSIPKHIAPVNNSTENISVDNPANTTQLLAVVKNIQPLSSTTTDLPNSNESNSNSAVLKSENNSLGKIENTITKISYINDQAVQYLNNVKSEEPVNINKEISSAVEEASNTSAQATTASINKPRKNNNISWTYYVSPSISYRHLADDKINNSVTHTPMIGYEAGTAMNFNIFKKLQFTSGLQLNFSGYNIKANNTHPTIATLFLGTETPGQYSVYSSMSYFGNNTGSEITRLKNYSLQASLPIGLQYIFAGNENIKFSAAASFQPSFIIASQAYLLSSDKRNYITNPDLVRNWNMNTSFATYVLFTSNKFNWQIGPQVRYQLLSTYFKPYQDKEHLINYGIRVGISKISK
ncbi:MAG: hypothetical protein JWO92_90 [Chitinophagaceae bacterium]|nr:hypothetical protein [Chitinophagaceae bacterium]